MQKILVIDDSPVNIQVLNELLANKYDILVSTNGSDAIDLLDQVVPDLILLDIMMPGMDGFTVCSILRAKSHLKDIPIIFITALKEPEDECYGLELGAVDFVTKPFNPAILKLRIRNQLELKLYRELYKTVSLLDGLTGIANRRAFEQRLEIEWNRSLRNKSELSLIMIDVDFFKNYNDEYHHQAGDDCLRMVAEDITASMTRTVDFAARYGGEEFVCILPDTDEIGAFNVAEKIRKSVEALGIPHVSSECSQYVTVSLGSSTLIPHIDINLNNIIESADSALYEAKDKGRNRTVKSPQKL